MASQSTRAESTVMRFEATVHATTRSAELHAVDSLDLDRVPDPEGGVRILIGPENLARLVAEGYEVRVQAVAPVAPLDPGLVSDEADVRAWFDNITGDARGEG
ncbi:MAG: hypothetical protein ACT4NY_07820 [Pseudonocardiales bacterium]